MIKTNKYIFSSIVCSALLGCSDNKKEAILDAVPAAIPTVIPTKTPRPITTAVLKGVVDSGLYKITNVCLDQNNNLSCEKNEKQMLADASGNYQFTVNAEDATKYGIVAEVFKSTGKEIAYVLTAPIGKHAFISPFSSVLASVFEISSVKLLGKEAAVKIFSDLNGFNEVDVFENYLNGAASGVAEHERRKMIADEIAELYVRNLNADEVKAVEVEGATFEIVGHKVTTRQMYQLMNQTIFDSPEAIHAKLFADNTDDYWLPAMFDIDTAENIKTYLRENSEELSFLDKQELEALLLGGSGLSLLEFYGDISKDSPVGFNHYSYGKDDEGRYNLNHIYESFAKEARDSAGLVEDPASKMPGWDVRWTSKNSPEYVYYLSDKGWKRTSPFEDYSYRITDRGLERSNPTGSPDIINYVRASLDGESIDDFVADVDDVEGDKFGKEDFLHTRYIKYAVDAGYYFFEVLNVTPDCAKPTSYDCDYGQLNRSPDKATEVYFTAHHSKRTPKVGGTTENEIEKNLIISLDDLFQSKEEAENTKTGIFHEYGLANYSGFQFIKNEVEGELVGVANVFIDGSSYVSTWERVNYGGQELVTVQIPTNGRADTHVSKVFFAMVGDKLVLGGYVSKGAYIYYYDYLGNSAKEKVRAYKSKHFEG